jgi:hypothetical protein
MNAEYPVWIRDSSGWMDKISEGRWLGVEDNDADGEFTGWDSRGFPFRVGWLGEPCKSGVGIVDLVEKEDIDGLRQAMLFHAELVRVGEDAASMNATSVALLWEGICSARKAKHPTLIERLERLFKRGKRGD